MSFTELRRSVWGKNCARGFDCPINNICMLLKNDSLYEFYASELDRKKKNFFDLPSDFEIAGFNSIY